MITRNINASAPKIQFGTALKMTEKGWVKLSPQEEFEAIGELHNLFNHDRPLQNLREGSLDREKKFVASNGLEIEDKGCLWYEKNSGHGGPMVKFDKNGTQDDSIMIIRDNQMLRQRNTELGRNLAEQGMSFEGLFDSLVEKFKDRIKYPH